MFGRLHTMWFNLFSSCAVGGMFALAITVPYSILSEAGSLQFTNVTQETGITHVHTPPAPFMNGNRIDFDPAWEAGGAAAEDFDGDGWLDLLAIPNGSQPLRLYMNNGDGTFTDEAGSRGVDIATSAAMGAAAADYDNDGDIDLCVARQAAPHYLLINNGSGHFSLDQTTLTLPTLLATSPSFGDVDNDGLLELALGNWHNSFLAQMDLHLYANRGNNVLEPYGYRLHDHEDPVFYAFSPRFADMDGDGWMDLPVACDFGSSRLFFNNGEGLFDGNTFASHTGTDENGMGSAIGDYDNDGDLDWFVSSIYLQDEDLPAQAQRDGNRLYRNRGNGIFDDVTTESGVRNGNWGWGSVFGDLDNDGDLDLFHVNGWAQTTFGSSSVPLFNGEPARLFSNLGDGVFQEIAETAGAGHTGQGRGTLLFDYDNDGDLDIYIANNQDLTLQGEEPFREPGTPVLLRNDSNSGAHWLKVTLSGTPPLHRNGIGSRVCIRIGESTQMRELHASTGFMAQGPGRIAHFGMGQATRVDEVRAQWINGDRTIFYAMDGDQRISVPSPASTVSSRDPLIGEVVIASGSRVEPLENARSWIVEGQDYSDPASVSFSTPGAKELRLDLYDSDGISLLRSEVLRVNVSATGPTSTPTPTPTPSPSMEPLLGDFNGDGELNFIDLLVISESWGR